MITITYMYKGYEYHISVRMINLLKYIKDIGLDNIISIKHY